MRFTGAATFLRFNQLQTLGSAFRILFFWGKSWGKIRCCFWCDWWWIFFLGGVKKLTFKEVDWWMFWAYVCFLLEVDHLISIIYIRWMIVLILFVYSKQNSLLILASCNNWSLLCAHMHTQPPPSNKETSQPCWDIISQSNVARSMYDSAGLRTHAPSNEDD